MSENNPVILVYRRTHTGDPGEDGRFGCNNCMGRIRDWGYDAVIGIGGKKPDPDHDGIKERITWIGIGPKPEDPTQEDRDRVKQWGGDFGKTKIYTFDKFLLLDKDGPLVKEKAKKLYNYMFVDKKIPRAAKNFQNDIYGVLKEILEELAKGTPPSQSRDTSGFSKTVGSKCFSSSNTPKSRGCS